MKNTKNIDVWTAAVGIHQRLRSRTEAEVFLELPSRGENPGPYVMSPDTARALARRLKQMADLTK